MCTSKYVWKGFITLSLNKICQNTGFLWPVFPLIRAETIIMSLTESKILSLYGKMQVRENPYSDIFYWVKMLWNPFKNILMYIKLHKKELGVSSHYLTPWTQDVFWTPYVRSIYDLCPGRSSDFTKYKNVIKPQ